MHVCESESAASSDATVKLDNSDVTEVALAKSDSDATDVDPDVEVSPWIRRLTPRQPDNSTGIPNSDVPVAAGAGRVADVGVAAAGAGTVADVGPQQQRNHLILDEGVLGARPRAQQSLARASWCYPRWSC